MNMTNFMLAQLFLLLTVEVLLSTGIREIEKLNHETSFCFFVMEIQINLLLLLLNNLICILSDHCRLVAQSQDQIKVWQGAEGPGGRAVDPRLPVNSHANHLAKRIGGIVKGPTTVTKRYIWNKSFLILPIKNIYFTEFYIYIYIVLWQLTVLSRCLQLSSTWESHQGLHGWLDSLSQC